MNRTERSCLGIINVGAARSDLFILRSTPKRTKRSTSCLSVDSYIFGTAYGRACHGFAFSFNSILYGLPIHLSSVPSNKVSFFFKMLNN